MRNTNYWLTSSYPTPKGMIFTLGLLLILHLLPTQLLYGQIRHFYQGGEGTDCDNWGFTPPTSNTSVPALTPGAVTTPLRRTGTNAIRAAGGNNAGCSGGVNCIAGGGATLCPMNGQEVLFNTVDVSALSTVQLTFYHRSHTSCSGSGFDSGENLTFTPILNGVAQSPITLKTGGGDLVWGWELFTYNVPAGTNTFAFRTNSNVNRSDELYYLDDIQLTASTPLPTLAAPPAITGGGTYCTSPQTLTRGTPPAGVTYYWQTSASGTSQANSNPTLSVSTSGTTTHYLRAYRCLNDEWSTAVSTSVTINQPPTANAGTDQTLCSGLTATLAANNPTGVGQSGLWTVVSQPAATTAPVFGSASAFNTTATFVEPGTYTLRWTVSATSCTNASDDVNITILQGGEAGRWTGLAANQDWSNCRNWASGVVPAGGNVTLPANLPANLGGGAVTTLPQNIPSFTANNFTIANSLAGGATVDGGEELEITGILTLNAGWINGLVYISNGATNAIQDAGGNPVGPSNTASYIRGDLTRHTPTAGTYAFPVGDATGCFLLEYTQNGAGTGSTNTVASYGASVPAGLGSFLPFVANGATFTEYMNGSWRLNSNIAAPDYGVVVYPPSATLNFCGGGACEAYTLVKHSGTWSNGNSQANYFGNPNNLDFNGVSASGGIGRLGYDSFSDFVIVGDPLNPMPVEWLGFEARWVGNAAQLDWRTTNEQNHAWFEVERSLTGQNFDFVAIAAGGIEQNGIFSYHYRDAQIPANTQTVYYRLRQVDMDGRFSYSSTRVLTREGVLSQPALELKPVLYPNPASDALWVRLPNFDSQADEQLTLRLLDATGREVLRTSAFAQQFEAGHMLDIRELAAGYYLLQLQAESGLQATAPVIKR
jgi:hypothetical protein